MRAQQDSPRDPQDDPGQEGEPDVPQVEPELVGTERALERRIAEPQPEPIQAERSPRPGLRRRCRSDLVHGAPVRVP